MARIPLKPIENEFIQFYDLFVNLITIDNEKWLLICINSSLPCFTIVFHVWILTYVINQWNVLKKDYEKYKMCLEFLFYD